jgi:hypothetical protein
MIMASLIEKLTKLVEEGDAWEREFDDVDTLMAWVEALQEAGYDPEYDEEELTLSVSGVTEEDIAQLDALWDETMGSGGEGEEEEEPEDEE